MKCHEKENQVSQLTHTVETSPSGKVILELNYGNERVLVSLNTYYPVEADFYILFLPGHKIVMEALSIMDGVELETPISFDHAQFLVADFFCEDNEDFGWIMDAVELAFQEAWPHVSVEG